MLNSVRLTPVVWFLLTLGSAPAIAPDKAALQNENPCDKAHSQLELNQCSGDQYQKSEARLSTLYAEIGDDLERDRDKTTLGKLTAAERAWIEYRGLHCDAAKHQFAGGSISPMIWADCMKLVTDHRIQELKFAYPLNGKLREEK